MKTDSLNEHLTAQASSDCHPAAGAGRVNIVRCPTCGGSGDIGHNFGGGEETLTCPTCVGDGEYDAGPATALPWHYTDMGNGLVIHGDFDGDADDEGRSIDCTDYVADMRDTGRADANAALIVEAVNNYAALRAQRDELAAALRDITNEAEQRLVNATGNERAALEDVLHAADYEAALARLERP